jgi:uncharacterized protein (DUF2336 family)
MENTAFQYTSQDMAPVLARLNAAYALYRDSRDRRPMARVQLTGVVSDLMALNLSEHEVEMVADVLIALARQAEVDLRKAMAERLSALDNVPVRLVMQMANDEIAVARPVLKSSPVLGEAELTEIIAAKGPAHWQVIAQRAHLPEAVIDRLADTHDHGTAQALAENIEIVLTQHAVGVLADMAQGSEVLALPLLRRAEVPDGVASQLYRHVGHTLKKFILKNYEVDTSALMETLDDVVLEFVERAEDRKRAARAKADRPAHTTAPGERAFMPTEPMIRAATQFRAKGLLTVQLMLNTLRRGQVPSFVAQFAGYCGLEPEAVLEILHQRRGRGLAVACRAAGVARADFISFYLLTNMVRSSVQTIDLPDLAGAVGVYERTGPDAARQIVAQSLDKLLAGG